jgi:hypothetical protein
MTAAISGSTTTSRPDSGTSVRRAMITPPTMRIGADTRIVRPMKTTSWTCWTSFVLRVISEAGPNRLTSTWENVSTLLKIALRRSRPKPIAIRAPQYTPITAATPRRPVTASMRAPVRRM